MEEMSGEVQVCSAYHKPGQVGSMVEPVCHLHSNNVVSFCRWKKTLHFACQNQNHC